MAKLHVLVACIALTALTCIIGTAQAQYQQLQDDGTHQLLDIKTPDTFNINSPLKQPDSLRSRPYFDFLSTLYRHDTAKQNLFRPYQRTRRAADVPAAPVSRSRRAIVFRPLFVYKQQQIKKQEYDAKRKRRY